MKAMTGKEIYDEIENESKELFVRKAEIDRLLEALISIAWYNERDHYDSSEAFAMSNIAKEALQHPPTGADKESK